MFGLFFLFFLSGVVLFFVPVCVENTFLWGVFLFLWVGYLVALGDTLIPRKYRYAVRILGVLFSFFVIMMLFEGEFPALGMWGNIFVGSAILYHGLLLRGLDNILRRASVSSFLWFIIHNLIFICVLVWFVVFERILPWLWLGGMVLGLVSLIMGIKMWRKRVGVTIKVVDVSSVVVLAALYIVILSVAVRLTYIFHLDIRTFWTILLSVLMVILGLWFAFGGGVRRAVRSFMGLMLGGRIYDPIKEWDDFVSDIEDVMDEDEICEKVNNYFKSRFGFLFTKVFWRDRNDETLFVSKEGEKIKLNEEVAKYLWYKDAVSTAEELWRMGVEIKWMEEGDFVIPMIFQKKLVGIIVQRPPRAAMLPVELIYMLSRNIAVMMTLAKLSNKIIEMSKFEQFNKVVSFIIHDIKNILSGLSILLDNWSKYGDDSQFIESVFVSLKGMQSKAAMVVDKLTKFRDLKREREVKRQLSLMNIRQVLESVLRELQIRLRDIIVEIGDVDVWVIAYDTGLKRVLENLILNALESMEQKSKKRLTLWVEQEVDYVKLYVRDTGIGMDEEFLRKGLFKPFVSTKRNGIGIGMYEVKTILREMGGDIDVVSQKGVGTTMIVKLRKGNSNAGTSSNSR